MMLMFAILYAIGFIMTVVAGFKYFGKDVQGNESFVSFILGFASLFWPIVWIFVAMWYIDFKVRQNKNMKNS